MLKFIEKHAKVIVVLAVMAGSTSGIFGSVITAPSMFIGFARLIISLPIFGLPVLLNRRDELKRLKKGDVMWSALAGFFLFAHFFTWFNAVKLTNVASAAVLASLHPLVVLAVTVFIFRKKVSLKSVAAIIAALGGGCVIAGLDYASLTSGALAGDIYAFCAGIFMGLYFAIGNHVRKNVPGDIYVFILFASCALCFTIGMVATGTPVSGYPVTDYIYIAALTIVCQVCAHAVFNMCIGHVDSLYVSAWESGESVFAIILGIIFLMEPMRGLEPLTC